MVKNFEKIMDALHGGIAKYDSGTDQFVFQHCSESAAHLLGCTSDELLKENENALEIVCEEDRMQVDQALRTAMKKEIGLNAYFRAASKSHHLKWCQLNSWFDNGCFLVLFSGMSPEM